mgnify:CR=1 FL=1
MNVPVTVRKFEFAIDAAKTGYVIEGPWIPFQVKVYPEFSIVEVWVYRPGCFVE